MKKGRKLTRKQAAFVAEYLVDRNATRAAIAAGYSKKTADVIGAELLRKTLVAKAIDSRTRQFEIRMDISKERMLEEALRTAYGDLRKIYREDGSLLMPHEWPDVEAASISGVETEERSDQVQLADGEVKKVNVKIRKIRKMEKVAAMRLAAEMLGYIKGKETNVNLTVKRLVIKDD